MNDPLVIGGTALAGAEECFEHGDITSAVRLYERAMDTGHPLYAPKAAASLGVIFSLHEREAAAQIAISRLTEMGYGHLVPCAWFCYGAMQVRGGKLADADAAFRRVPDSAADAHAAALCALWIPVRLRL